MTPDEDAEIERLAAVSGMPIPAAFRDGVLRQWRLNQHLAAPLLEFDLPEGAPPAPTFQP